MKTKQEVQELVKEIMGEHTLYIDDARYDDFYQGHANDILAEAEEEGDDVVVMCVEVDGESDLPSELSDLVYKLFDEIFTEYNEEMEGLFTFKREEWEAIEDAF